MSSTLDLQQAEKSPVTPDSLLTLERVSKSYRLWNRPHDRFLYGLWNQVPPSFPQKIRAFAERRKAKLGTEVFGLSEVSLSIKRGESVGIIGLNGSGKSTLLQLIAGVLQPTTGRVQVNARRVTALLELGSGFDPNFSGRENVLLHGSLLGLTEQENRARLPEVLAFSDIGDYFEAPVKTYSSGMVMRLAFASSITVNADLLIVDEALSVGDVFFQQKCYHKIRDLVKSGVTILLVSHDMRSVSEFCEEALLLDKGKVVFFGDVVEAINQYYTVSRAFLRSNVSSAPALKESPWQVTSQSGIHQLEPIPPDCCSPTTDAVAAFLGFAVLDQKGVSTNFFWQGDWLRLIFEVGIACDLENITPGVILRDDRGTFLHAKYEFQLDPMRLRSCKKGDVFRVSYMVRLDITAGYYTLSLAMLQIPPETIKNGKLSFADFDQHHKNVCGTDSIVSFTVSFNSERLGSSFAHFGAFDLPTRFGIEQDDFLG
ncbi:MAG: ABC transporter ATP-binding protein [Verrucomicrobia bacterium]|nr:ABC transporter ATP-binding protein [Verrucomicrobiota bacterium]